MIRHYRGQSIHLVIPVPISPECSQRLTHFESDALKVAIVGLGYVGLPLLLRCAEAGLQVIGIDTDQRKITRLEQGQSYIRHIPDTRIARLAQATCSFSIEAKTVAEADAVIVCVPTPLDAHREPDLSYVIQTMDAIAPHLREGTLVALESTTYPGTTEEVVAPRLGQGQRAIYVAYSPEREDPGNPNFETATIPKLVSGLGDDALALASTLYKRIVDTVVPVSSPRVAEMAKLLENIHRAVNIGLVNEMKLAADAMDIDIHEVIDAAATKPFGFVAYRPGPGIGGHCIPIDPFYLTWKAREYGVHTRFIELAGEINSAMPAWVVDKAILGLNRSAKAVCGSRVLILGVAYKKNIDDLRHSPALEVMERLRALGAELEYSDPHVPVFPELRDHAFDLVSKPFDAETLKAADVVVLLTDHDDFDHAMIETQSRLVIDTRGVLNRRLEHVVSA